METDHFTCISQSAAAGRSDRQRALMKRSDQPRQPEHLAGRPGERQASRRDLDHPVRRALHGPSGDWPQGLVRAHSLNPDVQAAGACAIVWLGGVKRYMSAGSQIGFDTLVDPNMRLTSENGSIVLGVYAADMGLSYAAAAWISAKGQDELN